MSDSVVPLCGGVMCLGGLAVDGREQCLLFTTHVLLKIRVSIELWEHVSIAFAGYMAIYHDP